MKQKLEYTNQFKFNIVLDAIRGIIPIATIAKENDIPEALVIKWKNYLLNYGSDIFSKQEQYEPNVEQPNQHISYNEKLNFLRNFKQIANSI